MTEWLSANLATVLISASLLALVALIVVFLIRKRKKGGCGCGCEDCPMHKNGRCGG